MFALFRYFRSILEQLFGLASIRQGAFIREARGAAYTNLKGQGAPFLTRGVYLRHGVYQVTYDNFEKKNKKLLALFMSLYQDCLPSTFSFFIRHPGPRVCKQLHFKKKLITLKLAVCFFIKRLRIPRIYNNNSPLRGSVNIHCFSIY